DRRVGDVALLEEDVAEVAAVGDRQASGLLPHRQQLQDVGERGLLEAALDGHQRRSSATRSAMSGQSQTTFSRLASIGSRPEGMVALMACACEGRAARPSMATRAAWSGSVWSLASIAERARFTSPCTARAESAGRAARYCTTSPSAFTSCASR